jgi:hypothetical protein
LHKFLHCHFYDVSNYVGFYIFREARSLCYFFLAALTPRYGSPDKLPGKIMDEHIAAVTTARVEKRERTQNDTFYRTKIFLCGIRFLTAAFVEEHN